MVFYRLRNSIRILSLIFNGSSYSNAKILVNSGQYNNDIASICCNLPFDSFSSRLFSTYDGIKYALGKEYNNCYLENDLTNSKVLHGFIAIYNRHKKYFIYNPNNVIIEPRKKKEIFFLLHKIRLKFNSTPFMNVSLSYVNNELKIVKIDCGVDILKDKGIYDFLKEKSVNLSYSEKNLRTIRNKASWLLTNIINYIGRKKGFLGFMYRNWLKGCIKDYKDNSICNFYKIHKAHKRGFFFYHVSQYGLTDENYTEYLSDYDYKKLRPIDGDIWRILWDKPSLYYVLEEYKKYVPEHYAIIRKRFIDNNKINDMYFFDGGNLKKTSVKKIIEMIKEKHTVAAKPFVGSHGQGFYKIEYKSNAWYVNNKEYSITEFEEFLLNLEDSYVFTEYIEMSSQFNRIYPYAVSTARIMIIKENTKAKVANAYIRFAHNNGGVTDNVAKGGIVAAIDIPTGKIIKAESLENHVFSTIESHPDTGENLLIDIDNWDKIKKKICEISDFLIPFTYLGFDIAFTESGFKIIEINTHQDLHKYNEYSLFVKHFLKEKCTK